MLTAQIGQPARIASGCRVGQFTLDLGSTGERVGQTILKTQAVFPYFWRKRSTRPAVSISFCLPV